METEAATVQVLGLVNMPGLLQTASYLRALFASGKVRRTQERLENDVVARLHRKVGGPEVTACGPRR